MKLSILLTTIIFAFSIIVQADDSQDINLFAAEIKKMKVYPYKTYDEAKSEKRKKKVMLQTPKGTLVDLSSLNNPKAEKAILDKISKTGSAVIQFTHNQPVLINDETYLEASYEGRKGYQPSWTDSDYSQTKHNKDAKRKNVIRFKKSLKTRLNVSSYLLLGGSTY